jgi:hypothetical protein
MPSPTARNAALTVLEAIAARLRGDADGANDVLLEYLASHEERRPIPSGTRAAARLAAAGVAIASEALRQRPENPEAWLAELQLTGEVEDALGAATDTDTPD